MSTEPAADPTAPARASTPGGGPRRTRGREDRCRRCAVSWPPARGFRHELGEVATTATRTGQLPVGRVFRERRLTASEGATCGGHQAYLAGCGRSPRLAADLLARGLDPLACGGSA